MATAVTIGRDWREKTVEETACGRCDKCPSGEGAASVMEPKRGFIVACADCLKEIEAGAADAERARDEHRRFLH